MLFSLLLFSCQAGYSRFAFQIHCPPNSYAQGLTSVDRACPPLAFGWVQPMEAPAGYQRADGGGEESSLDLDLKRMEFNQAVRQESGTLR